MSRFTTSLALARPSEQSAARAASLAASLAALSVSQQCDIFGSYKQNDGSDALTSAMDGGSNSEATLGAAVSASDSSDADDDLDL